VRSRNPRSSDEFGQDDPTVVDGTPLAEFETPETMPRCQECGTVVFFDAFTPAASMVADGLFSDDRCVRARDLHWYWCGELRKFVYFVPR
jgi:hypothetical protein